MSRPAPAAGATWWRQAPSPGLASLVIFGLALAAFATTFGHGFVWDDIILLDQKARFYTSWLDAWREPPGLPNMRMYRPLEMMSLWIDQRLWTSSVGFHVTQVLLHALNGVLVLRLILALDAAPWAALAGAALFVVHPVQVEAVAWLTCRADILTTTFALIAVLLLLQYQRAPRWWLVASITVAAFLATASKETGGVTLLLLLTAIAVLPCPPTAPFRARLGRGWPALVAATVGIVLCQLLRPADVTTGIGRGAFGTADLLNLTGAFSYHLARVLAPIGFAPYVPTVPTDVSHLLLAVLGGAALLVVLVTPARDGGLSRFGVAWFLLAIAPAVAVVLADFTTTPVAERRLYLGMVGMALVTAGLLTQYGARMGTVGAAAIGTVLAGLLVVTVGRTTLWHDELTLWTAVTERLDSEGLPYLNLGLALADAHRPVEAEAAYRRGLSLQPRNATRQRLSINLGLILIDKGALDEADELFRAANVVGEHAIAYRGIAMVARKRAQAAVQAQDLATANTELNRALAALKRALAINPRYQQAQMTLAGVFYDAGQYRNALAAYQQAVALGTDTGTGRNAAEAARQLAAWLTAHPEAH